MTTDTPASAATSRVRVSDEELSKFVSVYREIESHKMSLGERVDVWIRALLDLRDARTELAALEKERNLLYVTLVNAAHDIEEWPVHEYLTDITLTDVRQTLSKFAHLAPDGIIPPAPKTTTEDA